MQGYGASFGLGVVAGLAAAVVLSTDRTWPVVPSRKPPPPFRTMPRNEHRRAGISMRATSGDPPFRSKREIRSSSEPAD